MKQTLNKVADTPEQHTPGNATTGVLRNCMITLLQNETWTSGVHLTNQRFKHCTVMISPTVAAIIGGRVGAITSVTQFKILVEKVRCHGFYKVFFHILGNN